MPKTNQDDLLSVSNAAKLLGVSNSTVYRMEEQGILTPFKTPGGQRRFSRTALLEYLAESVKIKASTPATSAIDSDEAEDSEPKIDPRNKLNSLTGREWMPLTKSYQYQKGLGAAHPHAQIERQHPAPFSFQDVLQLIEFFTKPGMVVLDPFGGVGSTAKACAVSERHAISIELQKQWHDLAIKRLETEVNKGESEKHQFINEDSRTALKNLDSESVDFIVTSPPYWSILNKKADHKVKKERVSQNLATKYADDDPKDLANIQNYEEFVKALSDEFIIPAAKTLKEKKYLCIIVSDFRNKSEYVSFHSDLIQTLSHKEVDETFKLALQGTKVLIQNHKSLLPYGYPFAYVENIHHQYILIFRKVKK